MRAIKGFVRAAGVTVLLGGVAAWQLTPADAQPEKQAASSCPHAVKPLPADGIAGAAARALAQAPRLYQGMDTSGRQAVSAARSAYAGPAGAQVREECGAATADRTVVVELLFPKMLPSQSLSQGRVFVSHFANGYRVWEVAH